MKSFFVAIALGLGLTATAQTSKGNMLLGGNVGFSSSKMRISSNGESLSSKPTTNFSFSPNFGYFIKDNLAIGSALSFSSSNDQENDAKSSDFLFAPFVRYYFLSLGTGAKLMGQGSFGFGSSSVDGESTSLTAWSLAAGPAIFLTPNTALEITLGYNSTGTKESGIKVANNTIGFNVGFQVHLGK